jgi:SAM-dependent methyltransferase
MTNLACPSCAAAGSRRIDEVPAAVLRAGYAGASLRVDIAALLADAAPTVALMHCPACDLRWYTGGVPGDAAFYEALQQHAWYYQGDKAEFPFAAAHVQPGQRLLEVGCGRGAFAAHLPAGVHYRGIEFNAEAVAKARAAGLDVQIRDLHDEAREQAGAYDAVAHFQVLEHVPDPGRFMRSSAAALREGGRLIVAVPAEDSFIGLAESSWLNMPPHHLTRWSDRALTAAFRAAGVEPVTTWHEPVAPEHAAWQGNVLATAGWLGLLGLAPALAARAGLNKAGRAAMKLPGVRATLQARALRHHPQAVRGHSLCMVGIKRGGSNAAPAST